MMRKMMNRQFAKTRPGKSRFQPRLETLERREVFSATPYLVPVSPNIEITPILTVGDAVPESDAATDATDGTTTPGVTTPQDGLYRMAGIPDGLGAYDNGDGTFTVLMNHELPGNGVVRDHGSTGAFVSKWVIRKSDLTVLEGDDLIKSMQLWNGSGYVSGTTVLVRLCSADLPSVSAFYNALSGKGTSARIFLSGEESGTEGRAFAHIATGPNAGTSYELPYLGKFAWENAVASPFAQNKTIVAGLDDGTGGQVYFYVGDKLAVGNEIERAGLTGGSLFGLSVTGITAEVSATGLGAGAHAFTLANLGNVSNKTGAQLNTDSVVAGVTTFLRPEDGAWDPAHPNDFYFVTTNGFNSPSRLWKAHFSDLANPAAGGTITELLSSTSVGGQMFDNITVSGDGQVLIQEDVGNNAWLGQILSYNIASGAATVIARHNADLFIAGAPGFLTQDEESSGIIDLSGILGQGYYLADVQAHYANGPELIEGGQLAIINIDPLTPKAELIDGFLSVQGTSTSNLIELNKDGAYVQVVVDGNVINRFKRSAVESTRVRGGGGDDVVDMDVQLAICSVLVGGSGNDTLSGGNGRNLLIGGSGDDTLYGNNGDDTLLGGEGNDWLFGGNGDDLLYGGGGNDHLLGGNGKDSLFGEAGDDWLFGENGADLLDGGTDFDWLFGGNGADSLLNGEQNNP